MLTPDPLWKINCNRGVWFPIELANWATLFEIHTPSVLYVGLIYHRGWRDLKWMIGRLRHSTWNSYLLYVCSVSTTEGIKIIYWVANFMHNPPSYFNPVAAAYTFEFHVHDFHIPIHVNFLTIDSLLISHNASL